MKTTSIAMAVTLVAAAGAGGIGLYWYGMNQGMKMASSASVPPTAQQTDSKPGGGDRKGLYWHDPMVPGQKFDKPGKSAFMDMELVPVYDDETADDGQTRI